MHKLRRPKLAIHLNCRTEILRGRQAGKAHIVPLYIGKLYPFKCPGAGCSDFFDKSTSWVCLGSVILRRSVL